MVVMEATSDYWKRFYYLLEETVPVMLVGARPWIKSAQILPGRRAPFCAALLSDYGKWLARLRTQIGEGPACSA